MRAIITVYAAENGFFAEIDGHGIVVGAALSEVFEAAQTAYTRLLLEKKNYAPSGVTQREFEQLRRNDKVIDDWSRAFSPGKIYTTPNVIVKDNTA